MAKLTPDELRAQLSATLPADGSFVPYPEYIAQLHEQGNGHLVPMLRDAKRRGFISMQVVRTENGNVHQVGLLN